MRVYLAARYSRRDELNGYRKTLEALGYVVTSRWLDGGHQLGGDGLSVQAADTERQRFALEDWQDVMTAELVVSFTEEPRKTNGRGGRHVEFGAAYASGKWCVVIGPRENVFHHLPKVACYASWDEFSADYLGISRGQAPVAERQGASPSPLQVAWTGASTG